MEPTTHRLEASRSAETPRTGTYPEPGALGPGHTLYAGLTGTSGESLNIDLPREPEGLRERLEMGESRGVEEPREGSEHSEHPRPLGESVEPSTATLTLTQVHHAADPGEGSEVIGPLTRSGGWTDFILAGTSLVVGVVILVRAAVLISQVL